MADPPETQTAYPQPTNPARGCGFPVARLVAFFSLSTGAVWDTAIGPLSAHELPLFRHLFPLLTAGEVALGDRLFGSYADIAELSKRGVDSVFRLHARRKPDFRPGKRLGRYDHLVEWIKPRQRPPGTTPAVFRQLPARLLLREGRFPISQKGFRTQVVTLVTTLRDPQGYSKAALAQLYGGRWTVESDLRHLKTTMQMEYLPVKTPSMVRKEFAVHLLAYHLIRTLMWEAGMHHAVRPLTLSFQAARPHLFPFAPVLAPVAHAHQESLYATLLHVVSRAHVPLRPGRVEPRARKRRPKPYKWLQQPRKQLQKILVA
jgi:hypothetical protein